MVQERVGIFWWFSALKSKKNDTLFSIWLCSHAWKYNSSLDQWKYSQKNFLLLDGHLIKFALEGMIITAIIYKWFDLLYVYFITHDFLRSTNGDGRKWNHLNRCTFTVECHCNWFVDPLFPKVRNHIYRQNPRKNDCNHPPNSEIQHSCHISHHKTMLEHFMNEITFQSNNVPE